MIDKLHISIPEVFSEEDLKDLLPSKWERVRDNKYRFAFKTTLHGQHSFVVKSLINISGEAKSRIEVNPSHWGSWSPLEAIVSMFGNVTGMKISRIDMTADVNIPIKDVHQCARVKFKKRGRKYFEDTESGRLNGFYFGNSPEVLCVYNRGKWILSDDRLCLKKVKPGQRLDNLTRFELRKTKKKPDYLSLNDIAKYSEIKPFENLEWHEPDFESEHKKARLLSQLLATNTLESVRAELNSNYEFNRRFTKFLKQRDIAMELNGVYRENLVNFFE